MKKVAATSGHKVSFERRAAGDVFVLEGTAGPASSVNFSLRLSKNAGARLTQCRAGSWE
jgi:hypothetical protein